MLFVKLKPEPSYMCFYPHNMGTHSSKLDKILLFLPVSYLETLGKLDVAGKLEMG